MRRVVCAALILIPMLGVAADKNVEKLLKQMRDAYSHVKTVKFTAESVVEAQDQTLTLTSDLSFKAPGKVNGKISGFPGDAEVKVLTVISDGQNISVLGTSTPTPKAAYSTDELSARFPFANLETICFWDWQKQLSTSKGNNMERSELKILPEEELFGRKFLVLQEKASKDNVLVRYWVDPKTHLIWRTLVKTLDTDKTVDDSKIVSLETDVTLEDKLFKTTDVE